MGQFEERKKKLKALLDKNRDQQGDVPDALYTVQLQDCEIKEASASKALMVKREHVVLEGEHKGTVIYDNVVFSSSDFGMRIFCNWLRLLGKEIPDDPDDFEGVVSEIAVENPVYIAYVKYKDGFANVSPKELIEASSEKQESEEEETQEEETEETEEKETKTPPKKKGKSRVGLEVAFDYEGERLTGKVTADRGDSVSVEVGEETYDISNDELGEIEPWEKEGKKGKDEGETLAERLVAFMESQNIEGFDSDSGLPALKSELEDYDWDAQRDKLTAAEISLLEEAEILSKPKPKAPPKKSPAKKSTPPKKSPAKKSKKK